MQVRQGLKQFSNWPTFPQLYVNGALIGGLDILKEMKVRMFYSPIDRREECTSECDRWSNFLLLLVCVLFCSRRARSSKSSVSRRTSKKVRDCTMRASLFLSM